MQQTRPLRDAARVTLDGSGNGSVRLGPSRPNTVWVIKRITVQTSTSTLMAEARVYRGQVGDASLISGTFSGSLDTDDALTEELQAGEFLTVRWTGGDAGSIATATWSGDETTGMA